MSDPITNEIQQLQNKIAELEQKRLQKELEEENAKNPTFEYYFYKLFEFIKTKNDVVSEEIIRQRIYGPHSHLPEMQESMHKCKT